MSAASDLHQALEDPRYRVAEEAMARWLAASDFHAVSGDVSALSPELARKVGVTLDGATLLGLLPRSPAVAAVLADLAKKANAHPASTLQDRWGVSSLPFDLGRLKQRLREVAVSRCAASRQSSNSM